jgi:predicted ATPase
MIRHIHLENFKCFPSIDVDLGQLNVFAGANGAGKSTIIQALLLLFQSKHSGLLRAGKLQLNGSLVNLGTGRDVLFKRSESDQFQIAIAEDADDYFAMALVETGASLHTLPIIALRGNSPREPLDSRLLYLSADRLGPQRMYPMNLEASVGNSIGTRGEFAPLLYATSRDKEVQNRTLLLENDTGAVYPRLEAQFELWMARLFPGFHARTDLQDQIDAVMLGMNLHRQIGEPDYLRPSNVGFGVSIAFPLVLVGLLANRTDTLIVENPEAHLHPAAQSLIGEFFVRVAAGGAQVFVETHSDHVINGMRIASKNGLLDLDSFRFVAFSKTDEYGSHRVEQVSLLPNGEFDIHPESFFDQTDKDLRTLYGI